VPKREIFDRSDFPDFYRIKSSWVGDLVVKLLTYYFNFKGATLHLVSDAHAEHTRKELMRMLSMRISYLRVCSAWFEGTSFKFVIFTEGIKNGRLKNGETDAYAEHTHQFLPRMLSMDTSSLCVCSACA
jgi:hypothetical protein